jgi:hypothetical protein
MADSVLLFELQLGVLTPFKLFLLRIVLLMLCCVVVIIYTVHLGFNLFVQLPVGLKLERLHGTFRVFAVYMLCGLFGNIISAIFLPFIVTVGASG